MKLSTDITKKEGHEHLSMSPNMRRKRLRSPQRWSKLQMTRLRDSISSSNSWKLSSTSRSRLRVSHCNRLCRRWMPPNWSNWSNSSIRCRTRRQPSRPQPMLRRRKTATFPECRRLRKLQESQNWRSKWKCWTICFTNWLPTRLMEMPVDQALSNKWPRANSFWKRNRSSLPRRAKSPSLERDLRLISKRKTKEQFNKSTSQFQREPSLTRQLYSQCTLSTQRGAVVTVKMNNQASCNSWRTALHCKAKLVTKINWSCSHSQRVALKLIIYTNYFSKKSRITKMVNKFVD